MKIASGWLVVVLLSGIVWSAQAQARGVPPGTYLQTCGNVGVRGDTLFAVCRARGGGERRTELPGVSRCVGDIGNNNGRLQCNYGRGRPYGQGPQQPGYGQMPPPGYGPPR